MNSLTQLFFFSRNVLAVITSSVIMSFSAVEVAKAQSQPSCFMTNTSGRVVNLEHICDVKPQEQLKSNTITQVNNDIDSTATTESTEITQLSRARIYLVGNGSNPLTLNTSSTISYSSDRPVYIRRYREAQRFSTRNDVRNTLLGAQINTRSTNVSGKSQFIIYRYQN